MQPPSDQRDESKPKRPPYRPPIGIPIREEGKATGEFDQAIPTSVMLNAFFCLQSPRTYEALVVGEQMSPEELVKHLGEIYFKGIAAK